MFSKNFLEGHCGATPMTDDRRPMTEGSGSRKLAVFSKNFLEGH
ncbi:MAG: hypothetical protein ACE10F_06745 [Candidatus Methylomirabilales bacterium]